MYNTLITDKEHIINPYQDMTTLPMDIASHNVTLILSSPRHLYDQVKRPYIYSFAPESIAIIEHAVDNAILKAQNPRLASKLPLEQPILRAIAPNYSGIYLPMNQFSELWSYYLIIDNLHRNIIKLSVDPIRDTNRIVVSGYCIDEPVNPLHHGQVTLNYNAMYVPTHYTYFKINILGPDQEPVITYYDDHDILPNTALVQITKDTLPNQEQLTLLRPSDYTISLPYGYNEVAESNADIDSHYIDSNTLITEIPNTNTKINSTLHVPMTHMSHIVESAIKTSLYHTRDANEYNNRVMNISDQYVDHFNYILRMQNTPICTQFKIDLSQPMFFKDLKQHFPLMNVIPIDIPKECAWNVVTQTDVNVHVVYASVLASSIPSIMHRLNLAEVAFRYASWTNNNDGSFGSYDIKHIATHIKVNDINVKLMWERFKNILETDIFPMLLDMIGPFDLFISCQSIGYVHIDLHALEHGSSYNHGIYETYNFLGGINTPLVGTTQHHAHNTQELSNLIYDLGSIVERNSIQSKQDAIEQSFTFNKSDIPFL
jgi:hypothetical protein